MKTSFVLAAFFCSFVVFVSSARANSVRVRLGSSYGQLNGAPTSLLPNVGTEYLICFPNSGTTVASACGGTDEYDLLLQITSTVDLGSAITIDIPGLSSTSFNLSSFSFGLITCDKGTSSLQLGKVCTPTPVAAGCSSDIASVTPAGTDITLPASCITLDTTFYFDETSPSFVPGSTAPTPEPGSLSLLAMGLIPLGFYLRREHP
jgi:hypothetical protein